MKFSINRPFDSASVVVNSLNEFSGMQRQALTEYRLNKWQGQF